MFRLEMHQQLQLIPTFKHLTFPNAKFITHSHPLFYLFFFPFIRSLKTGGISKSLNSDIRINPFDLPKVVDSEDANDATSRYRSPQVFSRVLKE